MESRAFGVDAPGNIRAPKEYSPPVRVFLNLENYRAFPRGTPRFVNGRARAVLGKPPEPHSSPQNSNQRSFRAAQALGLRVPRTLLTNAPDAVRAFAGECNGKIIVKAVAKGVIDPENLYELGQERFMYTSQVLPEHLQDLDRSTDLCPSLPELLPKAMDLRVVVIGRQVFTIGIHAHSEQAAIDWRRSYHDLSYSVEQLPDEIEQKMLQLVRRFDLQYSSADFILTPAGKYYFLSLIQMDNFFGWNNQPVCRWRKLWRTCYAFRRSIAYANRFFSK